MSNYIPDEFFTKHNRNDKIQTLLESLSVIIDGIAITAPKGFETDLASTPTWLWSIYPPQGRYSIAAIIHDYLYGKSATVQENGVKRTVTRKEADHILFRLMQELGCRRQTPYIFWLSVRAAGWRHWHNV